MRVHNAEPGQGRASVKSCRLSLMLEDARMHYVSTQVHAIMYRGSHMPQTGALDARVQ